MTVPPDPPAAIQVQGVILACEGADDEAILHRMLDHLRITGVDIRKFDGKPQLPRFLLGLRDSTEFEAVRCVGIVRDADARAASALQSVTDRLRHLGLPHPRQSGGFRTGNCDIDAVVRTFGIFIMPDGRSPGELEDLCLAAIEHDAGLGCVQEFLDCVHARTGVSCGAKDVSKARLNAWLASRHDPSLRMGHAIASLDLLPDSPAFDQIKAFLRQLAAAADNADQPPA